MPTICCCSLAGTIACLTCSRRSYGNQPSLPIQPPPGTTWEPTPMKRVVEEFDKEGKLIKRTTEDI